MSTILKNKRFLLALLLLTGLTLLLLKLHPAPPTDISHKVKSFKADEERLMNSNSQQIFFLETHLEGKRELNKSRQACSVEAAGEINLRPKFL
jgi:hypothetical protein